MKISDLVLYANELFSDKKFKRIETKTDDYTINVYKICITEKERFLRIDIILKNKGKEELSEPVLDN